MKIEPTAEQRGAALNVRQLFIALVDQGFTEAQALDLVRSMLVAQIQGGDAA